MTDHTDPSMDTTAEVTPTRRGALRTVGGGVLMGSAAALGGVALTGCSAATEGATAAASGAVGAAGSAVASAASSAVAGAAGDLVKAAEIPVGGGKVLTLLKVVITQPTAGDYKAFSAVCPHQGCVVGSVTDGQIVCPCHGSTFDLATGAVTHGPAKTGLTAKGISVTADGITVT